jgi:hypothetical protein
MIQIDKNRILVERLCEQIEPLLDQVILVGGCAVGFLITDTAQLLPRPTDDVDLTTEITTLGNYHQFSNRLKDLGFKEDQETGVVCRWRKSELILDAMPMQEIGFGSVNSWFPHAVKTAMSMDLPNGNRLRHINAPTFIATKIESFLNRGAENFDHHDIEDIINVVNGRIELSAEITAAQDELKEYLIENLETFLGTPAFTNMIPGHLRPHENRSETVIERLRKITGN